MAADEELKIIGTDRIDDSEIVVEFSDETTAVLSVDQLDQIAPKDARVQNQHAEQQETEGESSRRRQRTPGR